MAKAKKTAKKKTVKASPKAATAKTTSAKKTSLRGTRYTAKQKAKILLFVDKYNAKHGRGGAAEAVRKFEVTPLTINKWMKQTGSPLPKRKTTADFTESIARLADVHNEMAELQDKLDSLRKEYVEIKNTL